jgi:DMSO/TMAO reductase YedYZ molybdopterin-dependent catalytic subunit
VGRRVVLGMLGLGGLGILGGSAVQSRIDAILGPLGNNDPTGLTGLVPAAGGFRYYSVTGSTPRRSAADYRLAVRGLVLRERTLSLADLRALPRTELVRDFQCVTGWRVPDVPWAGVLLRDVLDAVGVRPAAGAVALWSYDGVYSESLTLEQARRSDVLVAYEMFGRPVTDAHGGPVRLYVAPMYGYKSLKWLDSITVTGTVQSGYWEQRGYDVDAWVGRSNGRTDEPI